MTIDDICAIVLHHAVKRYVTLTIVHVHVRATGMLMYSSFMEFLAIECQRISRKLNISAAREQYGKGLGP